MIATREVTAPTPPLKITSPEISSFARSSKKRHDPAYAQGNVTPVKSHSLSDGIAFVQPTIWRQRLALFQPNIRLCAGKPCSQNSSSFSGQKPARRNVAPVPPLRQRGPVTMRQQDLHQCQAAVINFLFIFSASPPGSTSAARRVCSHQLMNSSGRMR